MTGFIVVEPEQGWKRLSDRGENIYLSGGINCVMIFMMF